MGYNSEITVTEARYAKGKMLVRVGSDGMYKSRAGHLAEALKGRWTHRESGYIMSPAKVSKLQKYLAEGWDAVMGELIPPRTNKGEA